MTSQNVIVTQLVVNSEGARQGVAEYEAAMAKAKKAAESTGQAIAGGPNSFEAAQRKWVQSLAAADPVMRAHLNMQKALENQSRINTRAIELGITTQRAAEIQLERVRQKHQGYVSDAEKAAAGTTRMGQAASIAMGQVAGLIGVISVATILSFAKSVFESAASLDEQAEQAGVSTEALQAYRAELRQSGISAQQTDQILTRLTRSIGAASDPGPQRAAFNELGVSFQTLKSGAEATLPAVARGLLAIPDAAHRAALEVELFGKQGQRLESALRALADPTADIITKQKALGQIMGTDLTRAADDADDKISAAWNHLKVVAADPIVFTVEFIANIPDAIKKISQGLAQQELALAGVDPGVIQDKAASTLKRAPELRLQSPAASRYLAAPASGYSTPNEDRGLAQRRLEAELAQKTAQQREIITAQIARANDKLHDNTKTYPDANNHIIKQISSLDDINRVLTAQEKLQEQNLVVIKQRATAAEEAAKKSREDADQRRKQEQEANVRWVDQQAKRQKDLADEIDDQIERQKKEDARRVDALADINGQLRDEIALASLSTNQREREAAVLEAMRLTQGHLTQQQSDQIRGLINVRQETERWRGVVDSITGPVEEYPAEMFSDEAISAEIEDGLKEILA